MTNEYLFSLQSYEMVYYGTSYIGEQNTLSEWVECYIQHFCFCFILFFPLQIKSLGLWVMVKNNITWVNRVFYGKWKGILLAEMRKITWLPPKKKKKRKIAERILIQIYKI